MILTDREIKIALAEGMITIDPRPGERAFSSTSVDLTLDQTLSEFKEPRSGIEQVVDPTHDQFNHDVVLSEFTESHQINQQKGYILHPKKLLLGWTSE